MKAKKLLSITFLLLMSLSTYSAVRVINQSGYSFSPSNLTVNVGDVVRWVWSSGSHTTTSTSVPAGAQEWDEPLNSTNSSVDYTVTVAGTYHYVCTPHESMGMVGSFTATSSTSVDEESTTNDFSIFPNPTTSFVSLKSKLSGEAILSNILGQELKRIDLATAPSVEKSYKLDLSDLSDGIYIVTLIPSNTKKRLSLKVVKD